MNKELVRANRVVVKVSGADDLVAEYYRTHKFIIGVKMSEVPDTIKSQIPTDGNKARVREEFRALMKKHADVFGINYDDVDRRSADNIRPPKYTTDKELMDDTVKVMIPDIRKLIDKCKYSVTFGSVQVSSITPKSKTGSGTDLKSIGITNGKYKNGNWAWANIGTQVEMKYKDKNKFTIEVPMHLVSGQIKKTKIGITDFNEIVCNAIVDCGYATEEELNPPKQKTTKKLKKEDKQSSTMRVLDAQTIRKMKKQELYEYANEIGMVIPDGAKFQTVRSSVMHRVKELKGE